MDIQGRDVCAMKITVNLMSLPRSNNEVCLEVTVKLLGNLGLGYKYLVDLGNDGTKDRCSCKEQEKAKDLPALPRK
jgi:hypothetical protein